MADAAMEQGGVGVSPANLRGVVYTYDKFDRKDLVSYPNGTTVDYTYNGATGWLSQVAHQKEGAANPFLSLTYTRNGIGLIKGVSESANGAATGSWAYDYDGLKRLTAATWTPSTGSPTLYGYTYDRNGNRRSYDVTGSARRHYVYNELDQLREERLGATLGASTPDKSYTWDKYGRMASGGGAGVPPAIDRLYKWTVDDRLVSVVLGDNPSNDPVIKYAYDHLGTRVSRSALGETAKHLTDYENPSGYSQTLAEVEGDGLNVLKNYFYGLEYGPLAQRGTTADSLAFLHGDHLQTTRQLTDSDGDVLLASSQKYEPFGTPTPDGLSSLTSYAFTGQSRDLDTGLQYHRARWLNTSQGRWLSTDPVFDFPANFGSAYGVCASSPTNSRDISGDLTIGEATATAAINGLLAAGFTFVFSLAGNLATGHSLSDSIVNAAKAAFWAFVITFIASFIAAYALAGLGVSVSSGTSLTLTQRVIVGFINAFVSTIFYIWENWSRKDEPGFIYEVFLLFLIGWAISIYGAQSFASLRSRTVLALQNLKRLPASAEEAFAERFAYMRALRDLTMKINHNYGDRTKVVDVATVIREADDAKIAWYLTLKNQAVHYFNTTVREEWKSNFLQALASVTSPAVSVLFNLALKNEKDE